MKRTTFSHSEKAFSRLGMVFMIFVLNGFSVRAQVAQNGKLYISENTSLFLSPGISSFSFGGSPATTKTNRLNSVYGKLVFDDAVAWSGASADHSADGYIRSLSTNAFTFPVGNDGNYAPLRVESIAGNAGGIDIAYFNDPSTDVGSATASPVGVLSAKEYWKVKSAATARVSLSWSVASDIAALTYSELSNLTIAGYNGTAWVEVPSSYDANSFVTGSASTLVAGSISSASAVNLNSFTAFTLALKGENCAPLVASNGVIKIWNGSWNPAGNPTAENPVIINAAYSGGSFVCNTLELNADVTLADNQLLDVVNGVTGPGKIIMSSSASVVQRNGDASVSKPNIQLTLKTRLLQRGDYTYFGTPITGNFYSQLANAKATTGTRTGALDRMYRWDTSLPHQPANNFSYWYALSATPTGKGFVAAIRQQAPFVNFDTFDYVNIPLNGTANNGDVSVAVFNSVSADADDERNFNLLGNPYPSALDADKFLAENTAIDGVIYIWKAQTPQSNGSGSYAQADYIAYTKAGTVYPGINTDASFTGKVASGQGFMVKSLANSSVTFTNCMRISSASSNNTFFRNAQSGSVQNKTDRYKLTMTNSTDVFSQILIGYFPNATLGYDRLYDASRNSVSSAQLYSILETDGRALAINARPAFSETDVVPLGVSKSNTASETFTIAISDKEGVFESDEASVYLHDKLLQTYHDFATGNYVFTTGLTSLENRFEVVYQNQTLSNPVFDNNEVFATISNENLFVNASSEMKLIEVYDITGRKIQTINADNSKSVSKAFFHSQGVYIAKIIFENGITASHKLINK